MPGLSERELFLAHGLSMGGEDAALPRLPSAFWDHPIWDHIDRVTVRLDEEPWAEIHWIWQGPQSHSGPEYRADSGYIAVHRFIWEACSGEKLVDDEMLRNVCGRRRCVFPEHWAKMSRSALVRALREERLSTIASTNRDGLPT